MTERTLQWERSSSDDGTTLAFRGAMRLDHGAALWRTLDAELVDGARVTADLGSVTVADGGCVAMLVALEGDAANRGATLTVAGANDGIARLLALHRDRTSPPTARPRKPGFFHLVGEAAVVATRTARQAFDFIGRAAVAAGSAVRSPRAIQWSAIPSLVERAGANSIPIVVMINFLIGAILAIQSSSPLERFGANIFVVDLVGISVARELGPLMTAIIVTGRSGAAYAAELGTMRVSEEIDALRTLGFDPMHFLVFPRVLALLIVLPLLTVIADFVGLLGGLAVAVVQLDITVAAFLARLEVAVLFGDVASGVIKSAAYAVTIALIACERGLTTRGGAAGVGASTTSAVVLTLFSLIALDAVFTALFRVVNL